MSDQAAVESLIDGGGPVVFVDDLDRAVRFYTETLGLNVLYRAGEHFAMLDAGQGLQIGLHPRGDASPAPGTRGAIELGFNVAQPIESVVVQLQGRGVSFQDHENGPVIDDDGAVKLAYFDDSEGNSLYLCEVLRGG